MVDPDLALLLHTLVKILLNILTHPPTQIKPSPPSPPVNKFSLLLISCRFFKPFYITSPGLLEIIDSEGRSGHRPDIFPPSVPSSSSPPLPEVPAVIRVWVAVFGHHHPVSKLPSCQTLHGLLGVKNGHELHKDLKELN